MVYSDLILAVLFQNLLLSQLSSPVKCRLCPQARTLPSLCHVRSSDSGIVQLTGPAYFFLHPQQGKDEASYAHLLMYDGTTLLEGTQCSGSPAHIWSSVPPHVLPELSVLSLTWGLAKLLLKLVKRHVGMPGWQ